MVIEGAPQGQASAEAVKEDTPENHPSRLTRLIGVVIAFLGSFVVVILVRRSIAFNAYVAGGAWFGAAPPDMLAPALGRLLLWAALVVGTGYGAYRATLGVLASGPSATTR